jgi:methyl-accepting chemotaxis protein
MNNERLRSIYELQVAQSDIRDISTSIITFVFVNDADMKKNIGLKIEESEKDLQMQMDNYSAINHSNLDNQELDKLKKLFEQFQNYKTSIINEQTNGDPNKAIQLLEKNISQSLDQVQESFKKLIDNQKQDSYSLYSDSQNEFRRIIILFSCLVLFAIIIGSIVSLISYRAVVIPVRKVTKQLEDISQNGGDLTQRIDIKSKDEIGLLSQAFNSVMDNLQTMIQNIRSTSDIIAECSEQLSSSTGESSKALEQIAMVTQSIAEGSQENVKIVDQTNTGLKEMGEFSKSSSQATKSTSMNSEEVETFAEKGAIILNDVSLCIDKIANTSREVASAISEVDKSSVKISEIVNLISGISAQTNLLALNAAIEAARAGEAGRGFSVVADEIRKLADESNNAARAIGNLIKENRSKSENAVISTEEVDIIIVEGVAKVIEAKDNFENILKRIKSIVSQIEAINQATQKQAIITDEMGNAIENIAKTAVDIAAGTQETSTSVEEQLATMEETSATAIQLSEMSKDLWKLVAGYNVK